MDGDLSSFWLVYSASGPPDPSSSQRSYIDYIVCSSLKLAPKMEAGQLDPRVLGPAVSAPGPGHQKRQLRCAPRQVRGEPKGRKSKADFPTELIRSRTSNYLALQCAEYALHGALM